MKANLSLRAFVTLVQRTGNENVWMYYSRRTAVAQPSFFSPSPSERYPGRERRTIWLIDWLILVGSWAPWAHHPLNKLSRVTNRGTVPKSDKWLAKAAFEASPGRSLPHFVKQLNLAPVHTQNAEGYSMKTKMAEELRLSDEENNRQVLSIPFVSVREVFFCKFTFV